MTGWLRPLSRLRHKLAEFDGGLRVQTWRNRGYSYIGPAIKPSGVPVN